MTRGSTTLLDDSLPATQTWDENSAPLSPFLPLSFFCRIGRNRRHEAEKHNEFSSPENGDDRFPLPKIEHLSFLPEITNN